MHPIICTIGPFTIYSYGLMLAMAFFLVVWLASNLAKKSGINPDIIINFAFWAMFGGILGARLFFILENFGFYFNDPKEIFMLWHGGLSWYGGLILGSLLGIKYLSRNKLPIYKVLDIMVVYIPLGQALGRIGCFLNGCCFGRPSRFGLYFPAHGERLFPIQLVAALFLIFIFFNLRNRMSKPHHLGEIFYLYLVLYSFKRFWIEFFRADNPVVLFGLTLFQILSLVIFISALLKFLSLRKIKE